MKRPLLWIVALVIAAAPVLADVCRLDCERPRQPECPLHQQAPHKCAHDHTIGSATLTRTSVTAPRTVDLAILVVSRLDTVAPISGAAPDLWRPHGPPSRSPRVDVLRI